MAATFETSPRIFPAGLRSVGSPCGPGSAPARRSRGSVVRSALLVVALVATVGTAARSHLWTSSPAAERVESSGDLLVLGPADTLWSIAGEHYPESRRVEAIAALEELNGPSGSLLPGDVLALPELR